MPKNILCRSKNYNMQKLLFKKVFRAHNKIFNAKLLLIIIRNIRNSFKTFRNEKCMEKR